MAKSRVKRASKKKPLALPSFLPGIRGSAQWHVREADEGETPHTLNQMGGAAEMAIPMDGSPRSEFIKLHELLHAAHSPVEEPRDIIGVDHGVLPKHYLIIAEEMRINFIGRTYVGYDKMPDLHEETLRVVSDLMLRYAQTGTPEDFLQFLDYVLISYPLGVGRLPKVPPIVQAAWNEIYPILADDLGMSSLDSVKLAEMFEMASNAVMDIMELWVELDDLFEHGNIPPWESVIRVAEYLRTFASLLEQLHQSGGESSEEEDDLDKYRKRFNLDAGDEMKAKPKPRSPLEMKKRLAQQVEKNGGKPQYQPNQSEPIWGQMTKRTARLVKSLPQKMISKSKYKATDEGAVPRYIHRIPIDGKIFGRKKKTPGGSVLIDDSGSMSWSTEDLKGILEAAPAVNIAAYSGSGTGELVILGKDGKYADVDNDPKARPYGGDNLVDLPALEWLATMPKPRIWVSDTYITIKGGSIELAYEQVYRICKSKDINIVATADQAKEVFEGKREIYR